jgi:hypothetical protein
VDDEPACAPCAGDRRAFPANHYPKFACHIPKNIPNVPY